MPRRYIFRSNRSWFASPLLIFLLAGAILSGLFVTQGFRRGEIQPLFLPTPTPTRIANSFAQEAETHFQAGSLDAAIASYKDAIAVDPKSGRMYAELARILTYSTESLSTKTDKQSRFDEAMQASKQAVDLSPDDSTVFAIRAFTLDWYASFVRYILIDPDQSSRLLTDAEQAVSKAITLDETNVVALVFRAEIMIDQQRWDQAQSSINTAIDRAPNLWDAHRVNGLFLESQGYYTDSIKEFEKAVELAPNMTFLYIKLGQSYRTLAMKSSANAAKSKEYYNMAIDKFAQAVALNEQLGIKDPIPYLGIGRTYAQIGESLASSINMNKALNFDPYNADVYAQLGMVYRQARNYEDAISALKCSVRGCGPDDTCALRKCNPETDPAITIQGMELNGLTVVYYYTYASLLAAMYLPNHPDRSTYCSQSMDVIREIRRSSFGSDATIIGIISESEAICNTAAEASAQATAKPTPTGPVTGTPHGPTPTPTRTPRPTATLFPTPKPKGGG